MTGTALPAEVGRQAVRSAAEIIAPHVRRTPVLRVATGSAVVTIKAESLQVTGSFKVRGALNTVLGAELSADGVVTASGGNHAIAVAYAAQRRGTPCRVYVPEICPPVKRRKIAELGADLVVGGLVYAECAEAAAEWAARTGALDVHAFDRESVIAGQGTVGAELQEQHPAADTVLVPVGGGGLVAGIAAWYGDTARVVGVEPESCPTLTTALAVGEPVDVSTGGRAADSLGARRVGRLALATAVRHGLRTVTVDDAAILAAQRFLLERVGLLVEPGGATAFAAVLSGAYRPADGEQVAVVASGSNADLAALVPAG
ncbi:threonine/serine dehydratase [Umezawaea tangerina]|uniref:threonine ammonia-lyase n=1 Tax=Umezawaea tangerina TaxID=84725 RepID=A0A2T0T6S8_9PSEU|nr:threonine/serine dehydratase [Umezawaea tangerina]PRY41343.1 threonine dehydratase [Umezawaea tangerina]